MSLRPWRLLCACSLGAISRNGTSQRPHAFLIEEPLLPRKRRQHIQEAYSEFQTHSGKPDPVGLSRPIIDALAGQPGLPGRDGYTHTGNHAAACGICDRQGKYDACSHSLDYACDKPGKQTVQPGNSGATGSGTFPAAHRQLRSGATDLCRDQQEQTRCGGRRRSEISYGAVLFAR